MGLYCKSSNLHAYIVGFRVPDKVSRLFCKLVVDLTIMPNEIEKRVHGHLEINGKNSKKGEENRRTEASTWPMEPMVPILVCRERPKEPVTGLMPFCETTIEVGKRLILDGASRWLTLPVNSNGWFENLRRKLSESEEELSEKPILPLCSGLPILHIDECEEAFFLRTPEINIEEIGGWRTLLLICWKIEYLVHRPWYHSLYWTPIWKRRLRRAISASNGGGHIV